MDQVLIWLLTNELPISLPHLIFHHMKHLSITPLYYLYGLWLTKIFHVVDDYVMSDNILSRMDLCVMGDELLKKDCLGFTPREVCVGCLKMVEEVCDMKKQMHNDIATQCLNHKHFSFYLSPTMYFCLCLVVFGKTCRFC